MMEQRSAKRKKVEGDAALVSASTRVERPVLKALMMNRVVGVRLVLHPAMLSIELD